MNSIEQTRTFLCDDDIDLESSFWWQERQRSILDVVKKEHDPISFLRKIQKNTVSGFDHRVTKSECDELRRICLFKYKTLQAQHPNFEDVLKKSEESKISEPDSIIKIKGYRTSNIYLSHLKNFLKSTDGIKSKIKKVLEIGGGYGSLSRIFLNTVRPQYFIVDMKISLVCAYIFLRENFPKLKIFLQKKEDEDWNIKKITQKYDVVLTLPSEKTFSNLATQDIDLCINVGSLQEMTPTRSNFFQKKIFNTLKIKRVYFLNYFLNPNNLNNIDHERNQGVKPIVPQIPSKWIVRNFTINDPVWCIDASERNWLEIVLEKKDNNNKSSKKSKNKSQKEIIEIIYRDNHLDLKDYRVSFKFILEYFKFLLEEQAPALNKNPNMLLGLINLKSTCPKSASFANKVKKAFQIKNWINTQIPEIKYMKERMKKSDLFFASFVEWVEIFIQQLEGKTFFIWRQDEETENEKTLRKKRKGLPSIDLRFYEHYKMEFKNFQKKYIKRLFDQKY